MSNSDNLQTQLDELEKIVQWFENDEIDVEEAIAKFEKGIERADAIKAQLETLENKISVLKTRFDQTSS